MSLGCRLTGRGDLQLEQADASLHPRAASGLQVRLSTGCATRGIGTHECKRPSVSMTAQGWIGFLQLLAHSNSHVQDLALPNRLTSRQVGHAHDLQALEPQA